MTEQTNTHFSDRCQILADLWITYKGQEDFEDFIDYNDLGLPLAYAFAYGIVESNDTAEAFVNEAWDLLVTGLGLEDTGFETLTEMLAESTVE